MLALTRLDARDCSAVLASAGGEVLRGLPDGTWQALFRPFEDAAASLPVSLALSNGELFVGAGYGGGPRVQVRDATDYRVLRDGFAGDPDSRTGVLLAADGSATPAPAPASPPTIVGGSPLRAEPHPTHPGYLPAVQRSLDALPSPVADQLAAAGVRAVVFAGVPVVGLPEFAHLAGVPTPSTGDGGTTYDSAYAVYSQERRAAYLPADADRGTVFHEILHAAWYELLDDADRAEWAAFHGAAVVTPPWARYEAGSHEESWAESGRRWLQHRPQPSPAVDPLVARLLLG